MPPRMRTALIVVAVVVTVLAWLGARSGVEVRLVNGDTIEGQDVRREGGNYVVTLDDGSNLVLPVEAVDAIRLAGIGEGTRRPDGLIREDARDLAGNPPLPVVEGDPDDDARGGIRVGKPRTLAGDNVRMPRRSDQVAVFGGDAQFQRDIVDNRWRPETDWNMDPRTQNNFAPSTWAESPIDPTWEAESAWDDGDVLAGGRSTWSKSVVDSTWTPEDAFAR